MSAHQGGGEARAGNVCQRVCVCVFAGICPLGDDPLTPGVNAIQLFKCTINEPSGIYLQYQLQTTVFIPKTANAATVTSALAGLATMRPFVLMFLGPSSATLCDGNTVVSVEFTQEFGTCVIPSTLLCRERVAVSSQPHGGCVSVSVCRPQKLLAVDAGGNIKSTTYVQWAYDSFTSLPVATGQFYTGQV